MASGPSIERRALIVAPSYHGLPNHELPGTSNDIKTMRNLTKKLNFNDVKEVVEDKATKKNILQALDELSRTAKSESIVLFYYSGHGHYLTSTKDEGLVPCDVTKEKLTREAEEACITGQDLLPFLEKFALKRVKLTVIFDCCHSGQLYRVTEFRNSGCTTGLKPRQVILDQSLKAKSPTGVQSEQTGTKLLRGGWAPNEKDNFFYIAACSPEELAFEELGKGGRLTAAIETVIHSLNGTENVSIQAFFRLVYREFKKNGWCPGQTPQLEGASLSTELFGINKVPSKQGVTVSEVIGDHEVILDAGCLQNLTSGSYSIFEAIVTEDGVGRGEESPYWLGTIEVTEGHIGIVETSGSIVERNSDTNKKISHGCLAYLKTPSNIKNNAWVKLTPGSVPEKNLQELLDHIKESKILNVSTVPFKIEDKELITISIEFCDASNETSKFWVARRRGIVIVPPSGLGLEKTMADNLSRYLRHKFALDSAKPPGNDQELMKNVSIKVVKIEKVKPFRTSSKQERIQEGLECGKDLYEDAFQYPSLLAHSLVAIDKTRNQLRDETGDAFVFQVTNHNKTPVHICVLFYQFDGAIKAIYPPRKGKTAELSRGDTAEDIFRVFIPCNSLRKMAQPDPTLPEPDKGIDTIVLYATSRPADFSPLLQTAIETDPKLIARGNDEKSHDLSDLTTFLLPIRKRCAEDHPDEDFKWVVEKREFAVVKNTTE